MTRAWRAALGVALLLAAGCKADFVTNASPLIVLRADGAWPDTLARTDTVTLSVALTVDATGDTLAGPAVTWTSSDSAVLTLTPLASDAAAGLPSRARALATAHAPGHVQVTVSGSQPGLHTTIATDSIVVLERWIAVTAGDLYTCALNVLHEAYCWGAFSWRVSGNDIAPQRVAENMTFSSISAGADYVCGVRYPAPAQTYCMGNGSRGNLGNRFMEYEREPVIVGGGIQLWTVTAGQAVTCGITTGFVPPMGINCWGYAATGQLGYDLKDSAPCMSGLLLPTGSGGERCIPRPVDPSVPATAIVVGRTHSCALVYQLPECWGLNNHGQLGFTALFGSCQLNEIAGHDADVCTSFHTEVTFPDPALNFVAIAVGGFHTCAVRSDGVAFCWGLNDRGQLGDGTLTSRDAPVQVETSQRFTTVVAAGARTTSEAHTCGLTSGGMAYCWGANDEGQLGDGTTTARLVPTPVVGGHTFASLSAGTGADQNRGHTCGVRRRDGAIYCWGTNVDGQLGLGATSTVLMSTMPVRVIEPK